MGCAAYFHDLCVLGVFLPAVLAGYWLMPGRRTKLAWLAGASLVFYGFWDVRFIPLLLASALVDYLVGLRLAASDRKRAWLVVSVVFNLGVLAVFKYAMFAADTATSVLQLAGYSASLPGVSIVLPVGISFYTFQSMSYTIDVYRGNVGSTRDLLKYIAFVTLFPQLVAGPIVRYTDLCDQLDEMPTRLSPNLAALGIGLFAMGLFKKVVIADSLAPVVDQLWSVPQVLGAAEAWLATLGYALQLYFDFSGYSDMAIGLGALMGLRLPENFRAPYQAINPSDFWRRWHITLSRFLRDYLYIPLGGSRGPTLATASNLMIVMALGGLWHGADATFVIWGVYHGFLMILYHATRPWWDAAPRLLQRAGTFLLVLLGWVWFRAETVADGLLMYGSMFGGLDTSLGYLRLPEGMSAGLLGEPLVSLAAILALLVVAQFATPSTRRTFRPTWRRAGLAGLMIVAAVVMLQDSSPFLYYQF